MISVGMGEETQGTNPVTHLSCVFQYHDRAGWQHDSSNKCVYHCLFFHQVIGEALARFRLEGEPTDKYQLVKVTLESGRGAEFKRNTFSQLI